MKIIITYMLLFLANCLAPAAISVTVNAKNGVSHSVILAPKKLTYKQRVVRNYLKLKAKFKAKFKAKITTKALFFGILGLLFLLFGTWLMISIFQRSPQPTPQGGANNEAGGFILSIGLLSVIIGGVLLFIVVLVSI